MGARLYRRGGVWYCWGYDAHGARWRESTKQGDRKAAEIVSREIARRRALASTGSAPVTLHEALVMVGEADVRAGRSDAVAEILRQKGRQLVAHFGPKADLRRLDLRDLERYADARLASVSRHTVAKELWALRRAYRVSGVGWSDALMPDLGTVYTPRDRWLTWGEYLALRARLAEERRDYLDGYVYTGARRSELHALTAADLDGERLRIRGTKTAGAHRWIPLSAALRPTLERRAAQGGLLFPFWGNDTRDLAVACKAASIAPVTPNDLRRTFCSWLANASVSPLVAARLMGHTSTRMVERVYARLGVEIQVDAVSRLPVYECEPEKLDSAEEVDTADDTKEPETP
jgi:integrase